MGCIKEKETNEALSASEILGNYNEESSDTTPPTISSISALDITSSGTTITWTTEEASKTQVQYGTTTSYESLTTLDPTLVTSHSQDLSGLTASTDYHYRVISIDAAGYLATSADQTFTTADPDTTPPTISDRVISINATENVATSVDQTFTTSGADSSLIASWKFDESTGTTASDSSGNSNDGTISGATWSAGKVGSALSFNGINDSFNAGNPASLQITGALSMEGWVRIDDLSVSSSLFGKGHGLGSPANYGYFLTYYAPTKAIYFDTYNTSIRDGFSKTNAIIDNGWHHIAATWDGTTSTNGKKLYIDGVLIAQKTSAISSMGNLSYDFRIGIDSVNSRPAKAAIDEVKVYNRALSAAEVLAEYTAGL